MRVIESNIVLRDIPLMHEKTEIRAKDFFALADDCDFRVFLNHTESKCFSSVALKFFMLKSNKNRKKYMLYIDN